MSSQPLPDLRWDRADRLAKSLQAADVSVGEIADYLGVHRNTVSGYLNRRIRPSVRVLRLWALRTGAPYEWIVNGDEDDKPQRPPPGAGRADVHPPVVAQLRPHFTEPLNLPAQPVIEEDTSWVELANSGSIDYKAA